MSTERTDLSNRESVGVDPSSAASEPPKQLPAGFSLASLMMLVTLMCVLLGLFSVAPGLGVLVTIAVVPALFRSANEIQRRKSRGEGTTFEQKALVFAASLAMVVVAGVASSGAFFTSCWGGFFAGGAMTPPESYGFLILGAIIGGIIGIVHLDLLPIDEAARTQGFRKAAAVVIAFSDLSADCAGSIVVAVGDDRPFRFY